MPHTLFCHIQVFEKNPKSPKIALLGQLTKLKIIFIISLGGKWGLQLKQWLFCFFYSVHRTDGLKHFVIYVSLGYFCLLCLVIIRQLTKHLPANCYVFNTNSIELVNKITVKDIADDVQQYSTHCSFFFQLVYLVLHQNNQSNGNGSFLSKTMLLACHRVVW